ncbi:MAG: glycine--tRNA ligase subunit beta [Betaproteobacteria bacterium]|nr:glycine--tRNA ligase subunit beta [Betaproteobacteria bacterium]
MSEKSLLVELVTEELPPKALAAIGDAFASRIMEALRKRGVTGDEAGAQMFATPRRLAVRIDRVLDRAPDQPKRDKVLPVSVAFDAEGRPSQALRKKLGALGAPDLDPERLERAHDGKQESLFYSYVAPGMALQQALQEALAESVAQLPIPKVMRYQRPDGEDVQFVRPAHRLVALHGDEVLPVGVLGLSAGRETLGHRFMGKARIEVRSADGYAEQLEREGAVVASFAARREAIRAGLQRAAEAFQAHLAEHEALLDEVTALVEQPVVYSGEFDPAFLAVPQECLILSMKQHQKYFPLTDAAGKLLPRFLIVSNLHTDDPSSIVQGNERVLRARLADAKFFFDQDRRLPLAGRLERLGAVVYHNKLGSQLERIHRIAKLAGEIAGLLGADAGLAERAARLAKADLVTDMVGEFPELQGIMGMHYARHDGEPEAVARAIEAHYHPRFANDTLPEDNVGSAVALADKLDTLVGIYGIGLVPTGDKDPFGLRRAALGVLRMLVEGPLPLDLVDLLRRARATFPDESVSQSVALDLHGFMLERLRHYLRERGFETTTIDAVVSQNPSRIDLVIPRLNAVRAFQELPEAASLAAANKRIRNILRKAEDTGSPSHPDVALMPEAAEKALFSVVQALEPEVGSLVHNEDYTEALKRLAGVRAAVDTFFDEVMVMTDEPLIRANRLALLALLERLMNQVADISRLAV